MAKYDITGEGNRELAGLWDAVLIPAVANRSFLDQPEYDKSSKMSDAYTPVTSAIRDAIKDGKEVPFTGPVGYEGLVDRINPDYGKPGTTSNCSFCTAAMEVASRGFDITARRAADGTGQGIMEKWFPGASTTKYAPSEGEDPSTYNAYSEMKEHCLSYGDGASGELTMLFTPEAGHSVHWRNADGQVLVEDGQTHWSCNLEDVPDKYGVMKNQCHSTRLDNHEPNWDALAEDGAFGAGDSYAKDRRYVDEQVIDKSFLAYHNKILRDSEYFDE